MFKKKKISVKPEMSDDGVLRLIKQVRKLEIKSRQLTNHLFSGEYHSAYRGQGMSFKEVKEYQPGDDIRFIDWNVSAKMGHTYTKIFEEERERSVFLMVDSSASTLFGTRHQHKKDLISEIAATLVFSAVSNHDKTGLLFFTDKVESYISPKKGKDQALRIIRELLNVKPHSAQTDVSKALNFLNSVSKHRSIIFILSDFADAGYEEALKVAARRHDVTGIQVYDQADAVLPSIGVIMVRDAETGQTELFNTNKPENRQVYLMQHQRMLSDARHYFQKAGAGLIQVATGDDFVKTLQQFFHQRRHV
jgi:uncharacterized protein (DUF58 family)